MTPRLTNPMSRQDCGRLGGRPTWQQVKERTHLTPDIPLTIGGQLPGRLGELKALVKVKYGPGLEHPAH